MKPGLQLCWPRFCLKAGLTVSCGNRKAPFECTPFSSRARGPPASNRQYHEAKTRILVIHNAPAETSKARGDSLRAGSAARSRQSDQAISAVKMDVRRWPNTFFKR